MGNIDRYGKLLRNSYRFGPSNHKGHAKREAAKASRRAGKKEARQG